MNKLFSGQNSKPQNLTKMKLLRTLTRIRKRNAVGIVTKSEASRDRVAATAVAGESPHYKTLLSDALIRFKVHRIAHRPVRVHQAVHRRPVPVQAVPHRTRHRRAATRSVAARNGVHHARPANQRTLHPHVDIVAIVKISRAATKIKNHRGAQLMRKIRIRR